MAGSVPTIKTRITLDGADDVKAKLQDIGKAGQSALDQIGNAGGALEDGGRKATEQLTLLGRHSLETKGAVDKFREALHIAHPALEEMGLGIGNVRALSAAAGTGLVGLSAAIVGGIVVGLAKLADGSEEARQKITSLYDDVGIGKKVFADVEKSAVATGRSVKDVGASYTTLTDILEKNSNERWVKPSGAKPFVPSPAGAPLGTTVASIDETLFNVIRAGSSTNPEAQSSLKTLLESLKKNNGTLTQQAFEGLPIGAQSSVSKLLGPALGRENDRNPFGQGLATSPAQIEDLTFALSKIGPAAKQASDETQREFTSLWDKVGKIWNNIETELSKNGTNKAIGRVLDTLDATGGAFITASRAGFFHGGSSPASEYPNQKILPDGDVAESINSSGSKIADALKNVAARIVKVPGGGGGGDGFADGGIIGGVGTGTSDSNLARVSKGEFIVTANGSNLGDAIRHFIGYAKGGLVKTDWDRLSDKDKKDAIDIFGSLREAKKHYGVAPMDAGTDWDILSDKDKRDAIDIFGNELLAKEHYGAYADGGIIGGVGTGTSDSNLARVSKGEFIVTANGSNIMDAVNHFASGYRFGGIVGDAPISSMPRFADGGLVPAMGARSGHMTVDLRTDHGTVQVLASEDTAKQLDRMSVGQQLTSSGRKPGWYGGR